MKTQTQTERKEMQEDKVYIGGTLFLLHLHYAIEAVQKTCLLQVFSVFRPDAFCDGMAGIVLGHHIRHKLVLDRSDDMFLLFLFLQIDLLTDP